MAGIFNRIGSGLGLLMSGPDDPSLSPQENAMARRLGIMRTGLGLLGAETGTPTLQALAHASLFGQQSGQGMRGQIGELQAARAQAAQRAKLAQQIGPTMDPNDVGLLAQQAVATGDVNLLNAAIGMAKQFQEKPEKPNLMQVGNVVFDPTTREVVADFREQQAFRPGAVHEGVNPDTGKTEQYVFDQQGNIKWLGISAPPRAPSPFAINLGFQRESQLADDFRSSAQVKRAEVMAEAWGSAQAAAQTDTPVSDQTLIVVFNRLIDPESVVREAEFERVAKVGGFAAQAQSFANRFLKEGRLPGNVRADLLGEIEALAQRRRNDFQKTLEFYRKRSERAGIDPTGIVYDPFEMVGLPTPTTTGQKYRSTNPFVKR